MLVIGFLKPEFSFVVSIGFDLVWINMQVRGINLIFSVCEGFAGPPSARNHRAVESRRSHGDLLGRQVRLYLHRIYLHINLSIPDLLNLGSTEHDLFVPILAPRFFTSSAPSSLATSRSTAPRYSSGSERSSSAGTSFSSGTK